MRLLLASAILLLLPAAVPGQARITGTVYSHDLGVPIAHARVEIPSLGKELFTSAAGRFSIPDVPSGTHIVVARFLGYAPAAVTVRVVAGATPAPVRIELRRTAVQLTEVRVEDLRDCRMPGLSDQGRSMQLAFVLGEMRENARRFRLLAREYPFRYAMQRSFWEVTRAGPDWPKVDTITFEGDDGWRYAPGTLLIDAEQRLRLPDLGHLADSAFIATHCFGYAGADTLDGRPVVRIDFLPSRRIRTPDVRGWIALDPESFSIRGTVFNLTNVRSLGGHLEELEVRTSFSEIAEALPIFSRVVGFRRWDPARTRTAVPIEIREQQLRIAVYFRGAAPEGAQTGSEVARPPVETGALRLGTAAQAESLLVDVRALDSTILVDMRYSTSANFTGAPLPGYLTNRALLRREAAEALARVQQRARREGYRLKVLDAYRPVRATDAMMEWTRRTGREDLVRDGYIAERSRHNLGLAVDLTLVRDESLDELPMGTPYDTFSEAAHTANATGEAAANRATLLRLMELEGFTNYEKEWWHFAFEAPRPVRFDLVIR